MALENYTFRLKAESGDSAPHDELGLAGAFSGGTMTLVDRGAGDYVWQFDGAARAVGPSKAMTTSSDGNGVTMAFRVAVPTYGTVSYETLIAYTGSAAAANNGLYYGKNNSSGSFRGRYQFGTSLTAGLSGKGTAIFNVVIRTTTLAASNSDTVKLWVESTSRSGTTEDAAFTGTNLVAQTLVDLVIGATDGAIVQVSDVVIWGEELSDADCAALADDGIRATLDVPAVTITLTDPVAVVTGSTASCTITRSTAASGNITYNLTSSATGIATVPATATILDGQTTGSFNITGVSAGSSTITATNAADSGETDTATANVSALKGLTVTFGQTNLSGLTFAWFDQASPDLFAAPTVVGTTESTDGSGVLEIDLTGTSVAVGNTGFLLIYKAGATAPDDIAFFGRLTVQDIG